jgi:glycosyltransferase involved in cell wall biosynthesis
MKDIFNLKSFVKRVFPSKIKDYIRTAFYRLKNKRVANHSSVSFLPGVAEMISYVLHHAYLICPNSNAELEHLVERFKEQALRNKSLIVYNGFDAKKIEQKGTSISYLNLPESFICCIGAIGPRKNQLNLIKAANYLDIPLVIVGKVAFGSESYGRYIRKKANENVRFIEYCEQEIVFEILKKSKGHIQPSYIETPGLISLEAAALGCGIVVSDNGPVREYFGNKAIYINPYDYKSIAGGLEKLYKSNVVNHSEYYKYHFSWMNTLKILLSKLDDIHLK